MQVVYCYFDILTSDTMNIFFICQASLTPSFSCKWQDATSWFMKWTQVSKLTMFSRSSLQEHRIKIQH